jgi:hypothetical protein
MKRSVNLAEDLQEQRRLFEFQVSEAKQIKQPKTVYEAQIPSAVYSEEEQYLMNKIFLSIVALHLSCYYFRK